MDSSLDQERAANSANTSQPGETVAAGAPSTPAVNVLLPLFGIESNDYQKFLNFLAAHDCIVDFRLFGDNSGHSKRSGPSS